MKKIAIGVVLIFWMITTFFLAISVVGWIILVREDWGTGHFRGVEGESAWSKISKSLVDELTK